jgi:hypothetical protein
LIEEGHMADDDKSMPIYRPWDDDNDDAIGSVSMNLSRASAQPLDIGVLIDAEIVSNSRIKQLRTLLRDGVRAMRLLGQCRNERIGIDDQAAAAWRARADEIERDLNRGLSYPEEALEIWELPFDERIARCAEIAESLLSRDRDPFDRPRLKLSEHERDVCVRCLPSRGRLLSSSRRWAEHDWDLVEHGELTTEDGGLDLRQIDELVLIQSYPSSYVEAARRAKVPPSPPSPANGAGHDDAPDDPGDEAHP